MMKIFYFIPYITIPLQLGCSVIIGNVKPIQEKSKKYTILDLSINHPDWIQTESQPWNSQRKQPPSQTQETDTADVTFRSQVTDSVISMISACKSEGNSPSQTLTLSELTHELLLGISKISFREEEQTRIEGLQSLQTTIQGQLNQKEVMLRAVVIKDSYCIYDLIYIAQPKHFFKEEPIFSRFVSSFHLMK